MKKIYFSVASYLKCYMRCKDLSNKKKNLIDDNT